jgi:hypothetical protein
MHLVLVAITLWTVSGTDKTGKCVAFENEVVGHDFGNLNVPNSELRLEGNLYGVGGHMTTYMKQCVEVGNSSPEFGWNWTRKYTTRACSAKGHCQSPDCYADFSFVDVGYGVSPFGQSTGATNMPVNIDKLNKFVVTHNVTWEWSDTAPGADPPETGKQDVRRTRFIYDFFLSTEKPDGTNKKDSITDEVTINLASNPHFPGSQPPGCLDKDSRFGNKTSGPVGKSVFFDGYNHYEYWYTDHHDAVPGTGTRFSNFRRLGADKPGAQPPLKVNLVPFFDKIKEMWKNDTKTWKTVGPYLGHISLATEIYDHSTGRVTFHSQPTFEPDYFHTDPFVV